MQSPTSHPSLKRMESRKIILELCARFGVPEDFGMRLSPLIKRACQSEPEARRRIMDMVERSFIEEAGRIRKQRPLSSLPESERRLLAMVAGILHNWRPPVWLRMWGTPNKGGSAE